MINANENDERPDKDLPKEDLKSQRINYEILPIEELRKQAKKLMIENYTELNKQKLIDAIRNAKTNLRDQNKQGFIY
jgi:hypothetical protein